MEQQINKPVQNVLLWCCGENFQCFNILVMAAWSKESLAERSISRPRAIPSKQLFIHTLVSTSKSCTSWHVACIDGLLVQL